MTLEFNKLEMQLAALGQTAAAETLERQEKKRFALEWLHQAAADPEAVRARVQATHERNLDWSGACPPESPYADRLDQGVACPPPGEPLTLIAADGSQIHPDPHAAALYYLVNVGAIVLRVGSGQTPHVLTQPELHFRYDELHDSEGHVIPAAVVDGRRDQAELRVLADLAEQAAPPVIAFKDGSLLLWSYPETTPDARHRHEQNLQEYLGTLDRLRRCGAAVAGYVDRSLRFDVSRMLTLSRLKPEQLTRENLAQDALWGLSDEDIFSFLEPGQRSARFIIHSSVNQTWYAGRGHDIWFFYLNLSTRPGQPELARVEVPGWVARDDAALERVHAALMQQSQILEGAPYPYVLARADELAVVGSEEKEHLETLIVSEMLRHHQMAVPSRKARAKEQARGGRRRHKL